MAKILVNYIYNKAKDEYKILDQDCVFADQPYAALETESIINKPLVVPIKNFPTIVDRDEYEKVNKRFFLSSTDDGKIYEDPKGIEFWLPKDTDVSLLRNVNGRLVLIEPSEEPNKESKPDNKEE